MKNCDYCKRSDHDEDGEDWSSDYQTILIKGKELYLCDECFHSETFNQQWEAAQMIYEDTDSIQDHMPAEYFTETV